MDVLPQYILALGYIDVFSKRKFVTFNCTSINMDQTKENGSLTDLLEKLKTTPKPNKNYDVAYLVPYPLETEADIIKLK